MRAFSGEPTASARGMVATLGAPRVVTFYSYVIVF